MPPAPISRSRAWRSASAARRRWKVSSMARDNLPGGRPGCHIGLEEPLAGVRHRLTTDSAAQGKAAPHLQERPPEGGGAGLGGEGVLHAHRKADRVRLARAGEGEPLRGGYTGESRRGTRALIRDAAE